MRGADIVEIRMLLLPILTDQALGMQRIVGDFYLCVQVRSSIYSGRIRACAMGNPIGFRRGRSDGTPPRKTPFDRGRSNGVGPGVLRIPPEGDFP